MAMPDPDPPSDPAAAAAETRNLPVPLPRRPARSEGWLAWLVRALLSFKASSIRSDLRTVLEAGASGFSPKESAMLQNILGLRERRVGGVMVPRGDTVSV